MNGMCQKCSLKAWVPLKGHSSDPKDFPRIPGVRWRSWRGTLRPHLSLYPSLGSELVAVPCIVYKRTGSWPTRLKWWWYIRTAIPIYRYPEDFQPCASLPPVEDLMTTRSKNESENSSNDSRLEEQMINTFSKGHNWSDPCPWDQSFYQTNGGHQGLEPGFRICLTCGRFEDVLTDKKTGVVYNEDCDRTPVWFSDLAEYARMIKAWRKHTKKTTSK